MKNKTKKIIAPVCAVGLVFNNLPVPSVVNALEINQFEPDNANINSEENNNFIDSSSNNENTAPSNDFINEDTEIVEKYVDIEDVNLIKAINKSLNKDNLYSSITREEIESIEYLDVSGEEIEILDGIENAINLINLDISNNNISDISSLSNMTKLEILNASDNNISNISSLSNMSSLKELDLSNMVRVARDNIQNIKFNRIENINTISNLSNLTKLNLSNNVIKHIKPLTNLNNLVNLDLSGNSITDISEIKNIKSLDFLKISNQLVELDSIKIIEDRFNVEYRVVDELGNIMIPNIISNEGIYSEGKIEWNNLNNSISDLSVVFDKEIIINDNLKTYFNVKIIQNITIDKLIEIKDEVLLKELNLLLNKEEFTNNILKSELESIEALEINNPKLKSINELEYLINLKELTIRNTSLEDFNVLSNMNNLVKLDLMDNNIKSVDFLYNLDNIEYLNLQGNKITSINSIDGRLPLLKEFNASHNNLYSVNISNLNNLVKLDLSNNYITSILGIEELISLEELNLDKNNIKDISLLINLENLNRLSAEDQTVYFPVLKHGNRILTIENTVLNIDGKAVKPILIYGNGEVNENLISWQSIDENIESLEFEFNNNIETENKFLGTFSGKAIQPLEVELFAEEGYLDLSLSTNQIKFEDFTGLQDVEIIEAIEINIDSDRAYDISASIPTMIRNVEGDKELDATVLSIKESNSPDYISFPSLNQSVLLLEDVASGVNTHTFDFKLNKDKFLEKDSYRAVVKFEINQK